MIMGTIKVSEHSLCTSLSYVLCFDNEQSYISQYNINYFTTIKLYVQF